MKLYKCRFVLIGASDNRCVLQRVRFIEPGADWNHYLYHPVTGNPEDQDAGRLNEEWKPWALLAAFLEKQDCFLHSRRDDTRAVRIAGIKKTGEELTMSFGGLNGYALSHNEIEMELDHGRKPKKAAIPPTREEQVLPWSGHISQDPKG